MYLLALVFLISGVSKLRQPQLAAGAILNFGFGSRPHVFLALLLGSVEVSLAVLLALTIDMATWVATLLLWLFAFLIARSVHGGQHFACHCFGSSESVMSWNAFARTMALAAIATLLIFMNGSPSQTLTLVDRVMQALIASALVAIFVLLARAKDLLQWSKTSLEALERQTA